MPEYVWIHTEVDYEDFAILGVYKTYQTPMGDTLGWKSDKYDENGFKLEFNGGPNQFITRYLIEE